MKKRVDLFSQQNTFLTSCDQTVKVQSDFEGIVILIEESLEENSKQTRLYLNKNEVTSLIEALRDAIKHQNDLI